MKLKFNYWFILITLGFPAPLHAQDSIFEKTIVAPVPESDRYTTYKNILYEGNEGDITLADVFLPIQEAQSYPAVIFVHGGPVPKNIPAAKDWGQYQSYGPLMTSTGLAGVVFNHRFNGLDDLQTASNDVRSAVNFIRKHSEDYSIDKNNICLWFFSNGGNFVAQFLEERPHWLKCMVIYYGVLGPSVLQSMGAKLPDSQQKLLDPVALLDPKSDWDPAFFIVESGKDNESLNAGLRSFSQAALKNNWKTEYWNHPMGPHAFDVLKDDQRSLEIIVRTLNFINAQLKTDELQ